MRKVTNKIKMNDAKVIFKNFAGRKDDFNRAGKRSFYVVINDEGFANALISDGWNVKLLKPRDENDDPAWKLQVFVSYDKYAPIITLASGGREAVLTEETVESLDYARMRNVNLIISPYNWEVNGKTGVKAYLQELRAETVEDEYYNPSEY